VASFHAIFGRISTWLWRRRPQAAVTVDHANDPTLPGVQAEAFQTKLNYLLALACDAGARAEQARIADIVLRPEAERWSRLAIRLALSGAVGVEQAVVAFAAADRDAHLSVLPRDSSQTESGGRVLH
jgi:hypothetical protein